MEDAWLLYDPPMSTTGCSLTPKTKMQYCCIVIRMVKTANTQSDPLWPKSVLHLIFLSWSMSIDEALPMPTEVKEVIHFSLNYRYLLSYNYTNYYMWPWFKGQSMTKCSQGQWDGRNWFWAAWKEKWHHCSGSLCFLQNETCLVL